MDIIESIKLRKSIRGYKPIPVSKEILTDLLEIATRAPSGMNSQPWEFTVLGGKVLDELKEALQKQFLAGLEPNLDFPFSPLTGIYKRRSIEVGIELYKLMGIARDDKEKRTQWELKMLRSFDAPNAIIVSMDKEVSSYWSMFSLGAVSHTIALAALEYGLGTCIEGDLVYYPDLVRQIAGIHESKNLAIGIAIGYPDWDFPANRFYSTRIPLDNIVSWQGV